MKPRVYLETSVISYLTARPSRDLIVAAHQELTREWWYDRRDYFDVYISELVIEEAQRGNAQAAAQRLELMSSFPRLPVTPSTEHLAARLLSEGALPAKALYDALHIAVCAVTKWVFCSPGTANILLMPRCLT